MNEQIKELVLQSGIHDDVCSGCPIHELEKFAQLIVHECISIVAKRKDQAIADGLNVDEAMSMAEMDLLDHFGVEL